MPSKSEVEQYIKDNAIEAALAAAVSATVKARPLDALAYLSQELAKATKPVAPCFFTVLHTFVPDKAAAWWEQTMKMGPDDYRAMDVKNNKLGFHCHSFMPAGIEGPINCMRESTLTRTSRGLRTVRTGYAYQPPSCCAYRRRRAACPRGGPGAHALLYGVPYVQQRTVCTTGGSARSTRRRRSSRRSSTALTARARASSSTSATR